jgi:hypothetical protein
MSRSRSGPVVTAAVVVSLGVAAPLVVTTQAAHAMNSSRAGTSHGSAVKSHGSRSVAQKFKGKLGEEVERLNSGHAGLTGGDQGARVFDAHPVLSKLPKGIWRDGKFDELEKDDLFEQVWQDGEGATGVMGALVYRGEAASFTQRRLEPEVFDLTNTGQAVLFNARGGTERFHITPGQPLPAEWANVFGVVRGVTPVIGMPSTQVRPETSMPATQAARLITNDPSDVYEWTISGS